MKLYNGKKITILIISIFAGLCFSAFLIYEQRGTFGVSEFYVLALTALVAISIAAIIIKKTM